MGRAGNTLADTAAEMIYRAKGKPLLMGVSDEKHGLNAVG